MSPREHTVHIFFSAKGGVGKTTLALVCARLAASPAGRVAFLDLDFTGSSIADGVRLVAPDLPKGADGRLNLSASPQGFLDRARSRRGRWERQSANAPRTAIPFLNDAFDAEGQEGLPNLDPDALRWAMDPPDGVYYFPSSSIAGDVARVVVRSFHRPNPRDWVCRLSWVVARLAERFPQLDTWVLDLPPGIFGFTHEALSLFARLEDGHDYPADFAPLLDGHRWFLHPYIVVSSDHSDMVAALTHPFLYQPLLRRLIPVINRTSHRERVRDWLRRNLSATGLDERLKFVEEEGLVLGSVFQDERLDVKLLAHARPQLVSDLRDMFALGTHVERGTQP